MVSFRHKWGFCVRQERWIPVETQPSFILRRKYVHATPLFVFPFSWARILIKANCKLPSGQSCLPYTIYREILKGWCCCINLYWLLFCSQPSIFIHSIEPICPSLLPGINVVFGTKELVLDPPLYSLRKFLCIFSPLLSLTNDVKWLLLSTHPFLPPSFPPPFVLVAVYLTWGCSVSVASAPWLTLLRRVSLPSGPPGLSCDSVRMTRPYAPNSWWPLHCPVMDDWWMTS